MYPSTARVTLRPRSASSCATPSPIQSQRQSATTMRPDGTSAPLMTSHAVSTIGSSINSSSVVCGVAPVATMTASGCFASTNARSTRVFGLDLDSVAVDFAEQVGDGATELRASRQLLGEQHLTAESFRGLVDGDAVAAFGGNDGRLHSCDAATDDHHVASGLDRNAHAEGLLASGLGVLDARDRIAGLEVSDAGLVAADARANLVDQSVARPWWA